MRVRIKSGAFISQDFGYFNWPDCKSPAKVDYEFEATWKGKYWECIRPGFGEIKGDYGNGSIFVFDKDGVEECDSIEKNDGFTISGESVEDNFCNMTFHNVDNKVIGKLDWSSGKFIFTGEAEESAKVFLEFIKKTFKSNY